MDPDYPVPWFPAWGVRFAEPIANIFSVVSVFNTWPAARLCGRVTMRVRWQRGCKTSPDFPGLTDESVSVDRLTTGQTLLNQLQQ